jgi:hypothetical protein
LSRPGTARQSKTSAFGGTITAEAAIAAYTRIVLITATAAAAAAARAKLICIIKWIYLSILSITTRATN